MISGKYISENKDCFWDDRYTIILDVKDCDKSYILKLIKLNTRYSAIHIKTLFEKSKKCIIRKNKVNIHSIKIWDDKSFTFYPYCAGVPYYFTLMED